MAYGVCGTRRGNEVKGDGEGERAKGSSGEGAKGDGQEGGGVGKKRDGFHRWVWGMTGRGATVGRGRYGGGEGYAWMSWVESF